MSLLIEMRLFEVYYLSVSLYFSPEDMLFYKMILKERERERGRWEKHRSVASYTYSDQG